MQVYRPYVIDAKGNILVDVSVLFPGKEIKNSNEFKVTFLDRIFVGFQIALQWQVDRLSSISRARCYWM